MTDEPPDRSGAAAEELAGRYGRHLFVLAYHLCGEPEAAAGLAARVIASQAGRPDLAGMDPAHLSIELYRGLLDAWRSGRRPGKRAAVGRLHQALAGLDAEARVVAVLRIAEGFDYEEIAALLGMPAARVRSALVRARRFLQERMHRGRIDGRIDLAMTLYLDARLTGPDLAEFEKLLADDFTLRGAVEFHRGLTLEFREEVPAQPAGFARLVRQECDRPAGGGAGGPAWGPRLGAHRGMILTVVAVAAAATTLLLWRPGSDDTGPAGSADPEAAAAVTGGSDAPAGGANEPAADAETVGALRSLGYIAGGNSAGASGSPAAPGRAAAGRAATVAPRPKPARDAVTFPGKDPATVAAAPSPSDAEPAEAAASPPPNAAASPPPNAAAGPPPDAAAGPPPDAAAGPPPGAATRAPAETAPIAHRVVPVPDPPPIGRDHHVVRSGAEWAAVAVIGGAGPPPADFAREMIVLLRGALGADPPTRLVVVAVRLLDEVIEIEVRIEPIVEGGEAVAAGQAIVFDATDRPVRIVTR